MQIETKRLKMIPSDSHSAIMIATQNYRNGPQIADHIEALANDSTLYGWGSWLVLRKSDDVILGDAGFKGKPNANQEVEIGYGFLETFWCMGYGTEAVRGLIDWAFSTMTVKTVIAETDIDNIGSIGILEKVGMEKTKNASDRIYWQLTKQ
ncbi:GNAT family N-acetyltransferase [Planococcus faecalis]|uniref:GNAT family N-acetyltransferase n=1 Tax=Planococcus faecalis TaxID=1598147 RepID=A0ABM6ISH8_9BACL|nr:GNAT family N-acetyltransferase [Planococcus faecalis]AQU79471.1 GNAT family N-acetyltransferase [Planococcus faecalis]OHX51438.1 GNAT family acetyltransferase [Planococcus faecalis]